jgi:hypothetical protein
MRHPFQPLPPTKNLMDVQRSITNLTPIMNLNNGEEKPDQTLKLVYRFVPTKGQKENS